MSDELPLQLVRGSRGHGVVEYALDVSEAARAHRPDLRVLADDVSTADVPRDARVHAHVTDRLFGDSPEAAADAVEALAGRVRLSITLHDVPQSSDGTMRERRIAAYRRFVGASEAGVVVNSAHERALLAEFAPHSAAHVIPLGARRARAPRTAEQRGRADLVVLIAGFVYPGKGHVGAIAAAAAAAETLRTEREGVGRGLVRAIGRASPGHEADLDQLRSRAEALGAGFEVTGFLPEPLFSDALHEHGVPVAAHEHVSASRSMLDWIEVGRRPLIVRSRYAEETAALRPGTMTVYDPEELAGLLVAAWREPERTRLAPGTPLGPTVADAARAYLAWWAR